jgi:hypothetical protein
MVQSIFNCIGNCSPPGGLGAAPPTAELWSGTARPLHMGPCAYEYTAALPGSRTGTARFDALLSSAVAATLDTQLCASVKLQLRAQLNARLNSAVRLPFSVWLNAPFKASFGRALSALLTAELDAALDPALKPELQRGLSP